jgi:tellurite resistance protein
MSASSQVVSVPAATVPHYLAIPASSFGIVLGMAGVSTCWREAHVLWNVDERISDALFALTTLIWIVLLVGYVAKWVMRREEALAEAHHAVQCCYISLIPVSMMLLTGWIRDWAPALSTAMIVVGVVAQLSFSAYRSGSFMRGGRKVEDTTAIMYLPTVAGNFVSAIALSSLGEFELAKLFLGAGIFSWLAVESILMHRLYTSDPLALSVRPSLGIQIAPPTVGSVAYLAATGNQVDLGFYVLFGYGLLQLMMFFRLSGWFAKTGFSPGYWGFSFGVTAIARACLQAGISAPDSWFAGAAIWFFVFINLFIAVLFIGTFRLLVLGRLYRT